MAKTVKVLMLVENASWPGDQRVKNEAAALADWGFEVSIICPKMPTGTQHQESYVRVDTLHVYRYKLPVFSNTHASYLLEYLLALMKTFCISLRVLFRPGFDVIHAANPPDLFFTIGLFYRLLGKKFIFDLHDLAPARHAVYTVIDSLQRYHAAPTFFIPAEVLRRHVAVEDHAVTHWTDTTLCADHAVLLCAQHSAHASACHRRHSKRWSISCTNKAIPSCTLVSTKRRDARCTLNCQRGSGPLERSGSVGKAHSIDQIEELAAPLPTFGCWPVQSRAALAISGDVNSVTVQDFSLRFLEVHQQIS